MTNREKAYGLLIQMFEDATNQLIEEARERNRHMSFEVKLWSRYYDFRYRCRVRLRLWLMYHGWI